MKKKFELIDEQIELLSTVLSQQSESKNTKPFRKWLEAWIRENVPSAKVLVNNDNLYVTKGKADPYYPCIVSHIDTVHDINPFASVFQHGDDLYAWCSKKKRQYGIGGDDKVGVFICLMGLLEQPAIKCAFFRDEEIGCVGSSKALKEWFNDCAFVLQCDRRGNRDFISDINGMTMYSKEFGKAIADTLKQYGYREYDGMMTDVEQLKKMGIDLCMANMSCGYYEPHSNNEYVSISDVINCLSMVMQLCREQHWQQWTHKGEYDTYGGYYSADWSSTGYSKEWEKDWEYVGGEWKRKGAPKKRWTPAQTKWDKDGRRWYLDEILGVNLAQKDIAGTGAFDDPYRLKAMDKVWELEQKYGGIETVGTSAAASKDAKQKLITNGRCPKCGQIDCNYDKFQEDWFCFTCGVYHQEAAMIAERQGAKEAQREADKAKKAALKDIDKDKDGLLPSTKVIQMTSAMLDKMVVTPDPSSSLGIDKQQRMDKKNGTDTLK